MQRVSTLTRRVERVAEEKEREREQKTIMSGREEDRHADGHDN